MKLQGTFGENGLLFGNGRQAWVKLVACAVSGAYAAIMTYVLLEVIDKTIGLRDATSDEREGLDTTQHGEQRYAG